MSTLDFSNFKTSLLLLIWDHNNVSLVTKVIDDHVQTLLTVFLECNRVANSLKTRIEDRDRDYSILLRAVQNTLYPHSRSASESCPISATKSVGSNAPATSITSQDCDSSVCAVTRRLCAQLAHQLYGLEKRCSERLAHTRNRVVQLKRLVDRRCAELQARQYRILVQPVYEAKVRISSTFVNLHSQQASVQCSQVSPAAELADLRGQLQEADVRHARLSSDNESMAAELSQLRASIEACERTNSSLQVALDTAWQVHSVLMSEERLLTTEGLHTHRAHDLLDSRTLLSVPAPVAKPSVDPSRVGFASYGLNISRADSEPALLKAADQALDKSASRSPDSYLNNSAGWTPRSERIELGGARQDFASRAAGCSFVNEQARAPTTPALTHEVSLLNHSLLNSSFCVDIDREAYRASMRAHNNRGFRFIDRSQSATHTTPHPDAFEDPEAEHDATTGGGWQLRRSVCECKEYC